MRISDWSSDVCSSDLPEALFRKFPPLKERARRDKFDRGGGYLSLIHAALATVLDEATSALQGPDPGRNVGGEMRRADEIVRIAAKAFMHTPGLAISDRYVHSDLFDRLNLISSLLRSEEHTSELQSLMRISYAVF